MENISVLFARCGRISTVEMDKCGRFLMEIRYRPVEKTIFLLLLGTNHNHWMGRMFRLDPYAKTQRIQNRPQMTEFHISK